MSKTKIVIIAICAVLVIGGAVAAVPVLRNRSASEPENISYLSNAEETGYTGELPSGYSEITGSAMPGNSGDVNAAAQQNADSNLLTTMKQVANTIKNSAATTKTPSQNKAQNKAQTTTTKAAGGNNSADPKSVEGFVQNAIGDNADQSFMGYRWSSDGYYYCDDKDCWQKNVGYNEVYDKWAPIAGMFIDQVRIRFQYDNKNYMIQFWKGQYGFLLIGAEIGIYTCGLDEYKGDVGDINHFYVADKSDWLKMQLDCYFCKGGKGSYTRLFTRPYDTYWWATGFVKGQLTKYTAPRTELKTRNRITFKTEEQANIFVQGLKVANFRRAAGSDQLIDDSYFQSGKDVWVLWSTISHDCFVGYGDKAQSF